MHGTVIINGTALGSKLSGIGVYLLGFLTALTAIKTDIAFIVYLNKSARCHIERLRIPPHMTIQWTTRFLSPDYKFAGHALRLLYANVIALRHRKLLCFNGSQLEAMLFRPGQIVMVHDIIPLLVKQGHLKQNLLFRYVLPRVLRSSAAIITPSAVVKEQLIAVFNLPASKIHVIHHGIEHARRAGDGRPFPETGPYILYVGRGDTHKNLDRLLAGFRRIQDLLVHTLVLVGVDGNGSGARAAGQERVMYKGYVSEEEKTALYRNASLLAFPSLQEGFGLPPLEAMHHGCPVVVSSASSIPEVCGDAAYYVDPDNVDSIADGIYQVATDEALRNDLIARGLERARMFSWTTSAEAHVRLFRRHLAERGDARQERIGMEQEEYARLPRPLM